jgi:alpha-L-rhamnosidase
VQVQAASAPLLSELSCEGVTRPIGVEASRPRLSWKPNSDVRGWKQSAYQVLVASTPTLLAQNKADLWNSGQVKSGLSQIAYGGKPLGSRAQCFWKVRVWDNKAKSSAYSAPSVWEMGLLQKSDWHGQWIGYTPPAQPQVSIPTLQGASCIWYPEGDPLRNAPEETRYFRRTVTLPADRKISDADLRIAADNSAIIFVNGREVGRSHDSWKTRDVFDVGKQLVAGPNVIAVAIDNEGTAAGLATQLDVKFDSGQPLTVLTNGTWKVSRTAPAGWQNVAFDDATWVSAREVAKVGEGPWGKIASTVQVPAPPAPHFRRGFQVNGNIKRATAYICGLGYNELYINGRKVGDHMLDPGWTRYDRRSLYVTHDVTSYLKNGANALGVILGTGHYDDHVLNVWDFENATWRTRPKMLMELRLDYADGRTQTITSDGNWKASTGPIVFDSISAGETYDARLEKAGWNTASYNDTAWAKPQIVEPVKGILAAQIAPPIRVTQSIAPVKVTEPTPGVFIFDLGQNIAGIPQLRISGPAGAKVAMRCAEKLHADGTLDAANIDEFVHRRDPNQAFQTDTYILKGQGREVWNPRFTYHGFQYVEVTGFPGTPTLGNLRGLVMHSDFDSIGQFECSNPMLNRVQQMSLWSYRNNFHSIPTDCPHREKNGWTGDAHLAAEMGLYNFDGGANYEKWLDDIADEQGNKGDFAGIIPTSGWGYNIGPSWDSAYPLIVWYLYQYRGDKRMIEKHYPRLVRYVDYVSTRAKDGIVDYGLGDWVPAKTETPAAVTSTAYYYVDSMLVAKMAQMLGKTADAKKYSDQAASIKTAFNNKFYNAQTGEYANGSLTALSCALYQGLVEPQNKAKVVENLVAEVKKQDYHMDVGILGAKYLLNTLADNGRADVVYQMLQQRTWPSYGHWVDRGATTLWEEWNGNQSRNHVMFGDVSAWFYKYLAGINAAAPGFKQIVIKPHILGDLTYARASYDSAQGRIVSDWKKNASGLQLDVTIPANTTATVYVPAQSQSQVTEGGKAIAKASGLKWLKQEDGYAVFAVGSGTYRFATHK